MLENTFTVLNDEGQEIVCDILFTFDNQDNGKSYIVYTDNTRDALGNVQVMASTYDPTQRNPRLGAIETEQEWKVIETILTSLQENIREKASAAGVDSVDAEDVASAVEADLMQAPGFFSE